MRPFIPYDQYMMMRNRYYSMRHTIRLGQYLFNTCNLTKPDPEIFYEANNEEAAKKFFNKYVIKEEGQ